MVPRSPLSSEFRRSASRGEEERPFLNPIHDPRPFVFPLLKIDLTRHGPCEERFADGGKVQPIDHRRQRDDSGINVSPRLAGTMEQTFPAHIAFETFGRSRLGNCHDQKRSPMPTRKREDRLQHNIYGTALRAISCSNDEVAQALWFLTSLWLAQRMRVLG